MGSTVTDRIDDFVLAAFGCVQDTRRQHLAPWWLRDGNDSPEDETPRAAEASADTDDNVPAAPDLALESKPGPASGATSVLDPTPMAGTESASDPEPTFESVPTSEPASKDQLAEASEESTTTDPPRRKRRRRRRKPARQLPGSEPESTPSLAEKPEAPSTPSIVDSTHEIEPTLGVDVGPRGLVYSLAERGQSINDERKIAMFCDFENIALGVRDSEIAKLEITLILARLLEKGKIIVKKAYADWERYSEYKKPFHEAAIELIDIPQKYYSGKNSADIKMVVDAMDLCYSKEHLDTFVLVSGDSDFSPLVSKLKENNKYVIGVGVKNSSSSLLIDNCDEFIYYEDIWRDVQRAARLDNLSPKDSEVFGLLLDAMFALIRENKGVLWGSMIKQTMQRKRPSFNEGYYGYNTFSELLEDGERKNVIRLKRDQRSGNYVVTGFASRR